MKPLTSPRPLLVLVSTAACALLACSAPGAGGEARLSLASAAEDTEQPSPGAPGLGDPYYPLLGNGGYDVQHYVLRLRIDPAANRLDAVADLRARALQGLSSFQLDLAGLEVYAVEVDGAAARFEQDAAELVVHPHTALAREAEFVVTVHYGGTPQALPDPAMPGEISGIGWIHYEGDVYVVSEPSGAASFYPVNDHPLDKATYTFELTVPASLVAVANGVLAGQVERGAETTWTYEARDPMSSYLVTVNVADFEVVAEEGPGGIPLRHYFPRGSPDEVRAPFEQTSAMLAFFAERFGPYPFEACGGIVARFPLPGALETQTIPIYGAMAVEESTIAHELAHQWFGNAVTLERWADIWVNEGLAEYCAWLWLGHTRGPKALDDHARRYHRISARRELPTPVDPGVEHLFGGAVYARGPLALWALHREIGDERFFALMREFYARFRGGNASVGDFVALTGELAGESGRAVLETWLLGATVPAPEGLASGDEPAATGG